MIPDKRTTAPETPLEVLAPSALETIERAQIDVQIATAQRYQRSLEKFKKRALDMVQQDIETAESCIYCRPVGKGDDGKMKFAKGASIRMAEIVAACYGNIRFAARIIEQTDRFVKAEGVAHDLESNTAGKSETIESTVKRNGQPYDERMRFLVAKATLSKALRDAIFRVVPRALCKSVYDAAQKVIAGQNRTIEQRRKAVQTWLTSLKVDDHRAFVVLGVQGWSEVGAEQLLTLTGLKTALNDQEITLDEAFPVVAKQGEKVAEAPQMPKPAPKAPENVVPMPQSSPDTPAEPAENAQETVPPISEPGSETKDAPSPDSAPAQATPEPDNAEQPETTPLDRLSALMEKHELSLGQVTGFCRANQMARKDQKLAELSNKKLESLVKAIENPDGKVLAEMKKIKA